MCRGQWSCGPAESGGPCPENNLCAGLLSPLASRERADEQRRGRGQAKAQPGESRD